MHAYLHCWHCTRIGPYNSLGVGAGIDHQLTSHYLPRTLILVHNVYKATCTHAYMGEFLHI